MKKVVYKIIYIFLFAIIIYFGHTNYVCGVTFDYNEYIEDYSSLWENGTVHAFIITSSYSKEIYATTTYNNEEITLDFTTDPKCDIKIGEKIQLCVALIDDEIDNKNNMDTQKVYDQGIFDTYSGEYKSAQSYKDYSSCIFEKDELMCVKNYSDGNPNTQGFRYYGEQQVKILFSTDDGFNDKTNVWVTVKLRVKEPDYLALQQDLKEKFSEDGFRIGETMIKHYEDFNSFDAYMIENIKKSSFDGKKIDKIEIVSGYDGEVEDLGDYETLKNMSYIAWIEGEAYLILEHWILTRVDHNQCDVAVFRALKILKVVTGYEYKELVDLIEKEINNETDFFYHIKSFTNVEGDRKYSGAFKDVLEEVANNTGIYTPKDDLDPSTSNKVQEMISKILTAITNIGMVCSILILAILGIKYMLGSVEEKAEYKKDLVPYLIGAVLLFGILTFVKIFMQWGKIISNI